MQILSRECLYATLVAVVPAAATMAQLPQHTVIPAAYTTSDAASYYWVAGASQDVRQQTLIGSSHLQTLLGRSLTALELRRSAADETFQPGTADLTLRLSTSPCSPLRTSRFFVDNVGPDQVEVFSGLVDLPTSPPQLGPTVAWTASNVVRIEFQTPFVYTGGTLCVDLIGYAVDGQHASWWMADAEFEVLSGTAVSRGSGCGIYGGSNGEWSHASRSGLVPGAHAMFSAYGTPSGLALAAFGTYQPLPLPLTALGLPAPGCSLHLGSLDVMMPAIFEPPIHPELANLGGEAVIRFWVPDDVAMFGASLTAQWFDLSQLATSNAMECAVASQMPTLDMSVVDGLAAEPDGLATVHISHVMRFEHQ